MKRKRYGLAPTPGTERIRPVREVVVQTAELLGKGATLNLEELPTHVPPPMDGPSGSW